MNWVDIALDYMTDSWADACTLSAYGTQHFYQRYPGKRSVNVVSPLVDTPPSAYASDDAWTRRNFIIYPRLSKIDGRPCRRYELKYRTAHATRHIGAGTMTGAANLHMPSLVEQELRIGRIDPEIMHRALEREVKRLARAQDRPKR